MTTAKTGITNDEKQKSRGFRKLTQMRKKMEAKMDQGRVENSRGWQTVAWSGRQDDLAQKISHMLLDAAKVSKNSAEKPMEDRKEALQPR